MCAFVEGYLGLVTSWWWLGLAGLCLVSIFTAMLKEDGKTSTARALLLFGVGLIALLPFVRHVVPTRWYSDFEDQWMMLSQESFGAHVIGYGVMAILFAPLCSCILLGLYISACSKPHRQME